MKKQNCMQEKVSGVAAVVIGLVTPFLMDGDITTSLFLVPLGIMMLS